MAAMELVPDGQALFSQPVTINSCGWHRRGQCCPLLLRLKYRIMCKEGVLPGAVRKMNLNRLIVIWLWLVVFVWNPFARGAELVQSVKCQDWSNYPLTYQCSFSRDTTPGNAVIVFGLVSGSADVVVVNITDDSKTDDNKPHPNTYTLDLHYLFGNVQNIYFYSTVASDHTRTITLTANISTHFQVIMMEVSGLLPSGPLVDRISTRDNGYNTGKTFTSGLTPETSQADEFLVGWNEQAYPNVMTFTDDPPWTLVEQETLGGSRIACRKTNAKGKFAYTGKFTGDGNYRVGAAILTYKADESRP